MIVKLKEYALTYEAYQVKEAGWTFDERSRCLNGDTMVELGDWIITTEALSMFVVKNIEFERVFDKVEA